MPERTDVKIHTVDGCTRLVINGHDLSEIVREVTFQHRGGDTPTVTLEIPVDTLDVVADGLIKVLANVPDVEQKDEERRTYK